MLLRSKGRLDVTSLSDERLEITYYKSAKEAIHVIGEVQNHGETVHIAITTLNGGVVFSVPMPLPSGHLQEASSYWLTKPLLLFHQSILEC